MVHSCCTKASPCTCGEKQDWCEDVQEWQHLVKPIDIVEGMLGDVKTQVICEIIQDVRIGLQRQPLLPHDVVICEIPADQRGHRMSYLMTSVVKKILYAILQPPHFRYSGGETRHHLSFGKVL